MLKKLWQLLMLYLVLGVDGDDDAAGDAGGDGGDTGGGDGGAGGDGAAAAEDDSGLPGDDLDSLIDAVETGGADTGTDKGGSRENAAIREARRRAQEAEEARIRAEATLDAERRMRQSATPTHEQALFEQEEAKLRDPDVSDVEKWQIKSNRTLRENTRAANQALTTAADMRDKTEFDRLAISNPKVHKAYEAKVEKALAEMRAKGQDAPRLALLRFMIGNDVMEGKLKSKPKSAGAGASNGVNRGKTPGARSDTPAKGGKTEREKRIARLENVNL